MPIFTTHDKQGRKSVNFSYISGMPAPWREGAPVNLTIDEENSRLIIRSHAFDWPPASMPFSRIFNVELFSEDEVVEKNKSVIKRGIAGALIAGPVGAIVGGMSGIGSKTKTQTRRGLAIDFITANGDRSLIFEIVGATYDADGFAAELLACVRKYVNRAKPIEYDVIIPREMRGVPLAYKYSVKVNITSRSVLEKMDADGSWELIAEQANDVILLSNRGNTLGTLMERVEMMSDWLRRGDPYKMVLEAADESCICTALLCFYREKRENNDLNVIFPL